jgi:hypothetical protein
VLNRRVNAGKKTINSYKSVGRKGNLDERITLIWILGKCIYRVGD